MRCRRYWIVFALVWSGTEVRAQSAACNQARAIVTEIARQWEDGQPPHQMALSKLAMARDLCPALGEAWKYSYCSAKALGDERKAGFYREQAIFNGIAKPECASGTAGPEPLPTQVRRKYALVVGISNFGDPTIRPLKFAAKDAADLRNVLVDPRYGRFQPENVYLLTDANATRAEILRGLNEIALQAQDDDLVLVFFSSHGSPRKDGLGLQGIGFIVTYDARQSELFVDSLAFEDLNQQLGRIAARRKVLLLDTCYSGQTRSPDGKALLLEGYGVSAATANMLLSGEGSYVITSSSANEVSYESDGLQNGYFTHFLIDALEHGPEPPTVREVFTSLQRNVREAVAREKKTAQNPRLLPEEGKADVRIGVVEQGEKLQ